MSSLAGLVPHLLSWKRHFENTYQPEQVKRVQQVLEVVRRQPHVAANDQVALAHKHCLAWSATGELLEPDETAHGAVELGQGRVHDCGIDGTDGCFLERFRTPGGETLDSLECA
jgi:hypothetical protein